MKHKLTLGFSLIALVLIWTLLDSFGWKWFLTCDVIAIGSAITAYGSYRIQANWFVESVNHTNLPGVSLTFDDGPDPNHTPRILDILKENGLTATFFVIGSRAEAHPELIERIKAEGHTIGNHSYSHSKKIGFYSRAQLKEDLEQCARVLQRITGRSPEYFRPPFGVTNPRYATVLDELRLQSIGWSVRSYDTLIKDPDQLVDFVVKQLKAGSILLLHDNMPVNIEALPKLIAQCKINGLTFNKSLR